MVDVRRSTAIGIACGHLDSWSHHDWDKTRELLAPNVHVVATTTQPMTARDRQPQALLTGTCAAGSRWRNEAAKTR